VLNYFSALGGMATLAARFQEATELLWQALDAPPPPPDNPPAATAAAAGAVAAAAATSAASGGEGGGAQAAAAQQQLKGAKHPRMMSEAAVSRILGAYEQLANVNVLFSSPQVRRALGRRGFGFFAQLVCRHQCALWRAAGGVAESALLSKGHVSCAGAPGFGRAASRRVGGVAAAA
jgi:hypothetical protein